MVIRSLYRKLCWICSVMIFFVFLSTNCFSMDFNASNGNYAAVSWDDDYDYDFGDALVVKYIRISAYCIKRQNLITYPTCVDFRNESYMSGTAWYPIAEKYITDSNFGYDELLSGGSANIYPNINDPDSRNNFFTSGFYAMKLKAEVVYKKEVDHGWEETVTQESDISWGKPAGIKNFTYSYDTVTLYPWYTGLVINLDADIHPNSYKYPNLSDMNGNYYLPVIYVYKLYYEAYNVDTGDITDSGSIYFYATPLWNNFYWSGTCPWMEGTSGCYYNTYKQYDPNTGNFSDSFGDEYPY